MSAINDMGRNPESREALASVLAHALEMARRNPLAIKRVAALFDDAAMRETLVAGLLSLVPADPERGVWDGWLAGNSPPGSDRLMDPERGQPKSARGAQQSATAKLDAAKSKVEKLKLELSEAIRVQDSCVAEVRAVSSQLRATVLYRGSMIVAAMTEGMFAMGPAWTIMRGVSSHLRTDIAWEASLSESDKAALAAHRDVRAKGSARILDLLDFHCGDVALEWKMHETMLALLEAHHAPIQTEIDGRNIDRKPLSAAAKRTFRRAEERRGSIRPGAPLADRDEVFRGLGAAGPDNAGDVPR